MREILFRGKRMDTGVFVEGGYFVLHGDEDMHIIVSEDGQYNRVEPETVSQFTGVVDVNQQKIFEGDIVKVFGVFGEIEVSDVVNWSKLFSMWHVGEFTMLYNSENINRHQIIGNIYDNQELLEEIHEL